MMPEDRIALGRAEDKQELKAIEDIRQYGVHILHVFDDKGIAPDFSYTVGLWHAHGHPEILISGLKEGLRHSLLNHLGRMIAQGREFNSGQSCTDVIDNYRCYFQALRKDQYKKYLGWDLWSYGGDDLDAVQMLWPSIHHVYPWDKQADEYLKNAQEILTPIPTRVA